MLQVFSFLSSSILIPLPPMTGALGAIGVSGRTEKEVVYRTVINICYPKDYKFNGGLIERKEIDKITR